MARRGRFGRLPRSAPDLSSTLVAILREYQAQRDRNIQEAWEKGGDFEGHKVTDDMILAHWKDRRDTVSKDDPLYDTYQQSVQNMEFGIDNSKQELRYAQGKVNDGAMAAYYRGWATKYPVDSEAYRRMMMLAAQYTERSKAMRSAGRRGASHAVYGGNVEAAQKKTVAYKTIRDVLTTMALNRGILNTSEEDLLDMRAYEGEMGDSREFMGLINELATSQAPEMVSAREQLTAYIRQYGNPNFNGDFSYESWMAMRPDAKAGLSSVLRLAQQSGLKGDTTKALKELTEFSTEGLRFGLIDEVAAYEEYRRGWDTIMADPATSVIEKWEATNQYRNQLNALMGRVTAERGGDITLGSTVEGHLYSELQALNGERVNKPTLWDDSRGAVAAAKSDPTKSDAYTTADSIERMYGDLQKLMTGEYVSVMVDGNNSPTIAGGGSMGVVPRASLGEGTAYIAGTMGVKTVNIPNADGTVSNVGTDTMLTAIVGAPVMSQAARVDENGRPIPGSAGSVEAAAGTTDVVAWKLTMPDGSEGWKYLDATGEPRYSSVAPYGEGVNVFERPDGTTILTMLVPEGAATYTPAGGLNPAYLGLADSLTDTVFKSTMAMWMSSAAKQSKGLPSLSNDSVRASVYAETGGDPGRYAAALTEVDLMKAEYIQERPNAAAIYGSIADRTEFDETFGAVLGPAERAAAGRLWAEGRRANVLANTPQAIAERTGRRIAEGVYVLPNGQTTYITPQKAIANIVAPPARDDWYVPGGPSEATSANARALMDFIRQQGSDVTTGILGRPPVSAAQRPPWAAPGATPFFKPRAPNPYVAPSRPPTPTPGLPTPEFTVPPPPIPNVQPGMSSSIFRPTPPPPPPVVTLPRIGGK